MNIENVKAQVKEAVKGDPFFQKQIEAGMEKHRVIFREYIELHPKSNFEEWKAKIEGTVNRHASQEIMAIGIFLLALDEFNHENL